MTFSDNHPAPKKIPVAEIISIGEELLIGQTVNTNAAWIAAQLNTIGIQVKKIIVITDDMEEIINGIKTACGESDIVLMTGGLGPTRDDITKQALCRYFDTTLQMDHAVLSDITEFFRNRGLDMIERNSLQAMVPKNATIIRNPFGTAPGLWFNENEKILVAMPGVPFEMQNMLTSTIIPELSKSTGPHQIIHKTVLTTGIGESFLADKISDWEDALPAAVSLAYLPSPGVVKLRLSCKGSHKKRIEETIDRQIEKLQKIIPQYIWGYDNDKLEELLGRALTARGMSIGTAESCTGGYIAHRITSVPGSSAYFRGSVIAYDNLVKQELLSVGKETLDSNGAVSRPVVEAMAVNTRKLLHCDYALAVSGIAGPGGGTGDKPVGTVWIALASDDGLISRKFGFGDNRERNIIRAGITALWMLLKAVRRH